MNNRRKKITVLLIVCVIMLIQILPAATAFAADLSDALSFITNVSLTDRDGNPLGDNIPKDSDLKLKYDYTIPNDADVHEGDTFTLHIPDEIAITAPGTFDLIDDGSGQVIGNGAIATDGTLVITFTHFVEVYSNIHGDFWFDLAFDAGKIGTNDPYTITFNVGASSDPFIIEVNFDQPEAPRPTITKSGSFDAATKQITWTVTVDPEDVEVDNAVVTDTIASGQTFVPGSVTINGDPADMGNCDYTAPTLTYTFPGTIFAQQVITFITTVEDSEFSGSSEGATLTEHNTAELTRDGGGATSNDATISTTVDFIRKSGTYDGANRKIDWTITADNNYVTITDAVVTDTIPAGLTMDFDSVKLDGSSSFPVGTTISLVGQVFTFEFGGTINEPHTITYSTAMDASFYDINQSHTFTNGAVITGTNVPGTPSASRGVGVTSTVIDKQGHAYDRATGQITWYIYADPNAIDIINCLVTDDIPAGQEFIAGSLKIDGSAATQGIDYIYTAPASDPAYSGSLEIPMGEINEQHLIEFRTQVTDTAVYMSNADTYYSNTAYIHGNNIPDSHDTANQHVVSNVISKSGTDYNYDTREATWRIVVDANQMSLSTVVVTDDIKAGQEFVGGSVTYDGSAASPADFTYTPVTGDPAKTGTLVYNAGNISGQHIITFRTHVTDLTIFATNGDKTLSNSASLVHTLLPGGVTSTGTRTVHNTVISKTGNYTSGNKYIDWTVIINTNTVPLSDAVITDTFQQGLQLDTASIALCHMDVNPDGSLIPGDEVELGAGNIVYDYGTRKLTFTIPAPVTGSYRLTFRTNVTDKNQSPFTNSASFSGTGTEQTGASSQIAVAWSGSGSSGTGVVGSIRVYKVDSSDDTKILEGCTFELLDRFGNKVDEQTTGPGGSALFEMLRFDVNYTVREVTPPEGYLLSDEEYTFQIHGADENHDIEYRYADEVKRGSITFSKYDLDMNPVPGTEFTLYAADDTDFSAPLMTALSVSGGAVLFENVPYGSYAIKETSPAEGFVGSDTVLTAEVTEDGATVTTDPAYIQDGRIYGSITMLKLASDGVTPLQGATFKLYKSTDTKFKSPVATDVSDIGGIVLFENILYGSYVIRETAAPSDYAVSSTKVSVTVTQNGTTVDAGTFRDRKKTDEHSPGTGDEIYFYIGMFILCAAGIAALTLAPALFGRPKRQRDLK